MLIDLDLQERGCPLGEWGLIDEHAGTQIDSVLGSVHHVHVWRTFRVTRDVFGDDKKKILRALIEYFEDFII